MLNKVTAKILLYMSVFYAGMDIADRHKAQVVSPHALAIALVIIAVNFATKDTHAR